MKIVHIIVGLNRGGAERMLERLVASHASNPQFNHRVISLTEVGEIGNSIRKSGVEVTGLEMRSAWGAPFALFRLWLALRAERASIIQTWMYHADLLGGVTAKLTGNRRIIWGVRSTDIISGTSKLTGLLRRVCALLSRSVPAAIVCVAESALEAHALVGYTRSKLLVIANGFDADALAKSRQRRSDLRRACQWSDNEIVVGCVGRFNHYKHQENFVRAAGVLGQRFPNVRFVMIGEGMDLANTELAGWIGATTMPDRFTLLNHQSDASGWLASMDVFCLSSRSEAFPNVVGEAMGVGIPCVVTDVGDAALLVGDTGIVVPKEDHSALAEGLTRMVETPADVRRSLGERAARRIKTEFSMDRARKQFEDLYRSLEVQQDS